MSEASHQQHAATAGKRARTRAALLDAALAVIAAHGPQAAGIDAVVRRAGMARGTFYNYFQTVPELLAAVTEHMLARTEASIAPHLDGGWNAPATIACLLRAFLQVCIDDPPFGRAWSRLGCEMDWLDRRNDTETGRAWNEALDQLVPRRERRAAATAVLSGTAMMTLRLALDGRLSAEDIDRTLAMALRALGASSAQIGPAVRRAAALAQAIARAGHETLA